MLGAVQNPWWLRSLVTWSSSAAEPLPCSFARSTSDQRFGRQLDEVRDAGCERTFTDEAIEVKTERDIIGKRTMAEFYS